MKYEVRILETAKKDIKKLTKKYKNIKEDLKELLNILEKNPKNGIELGDSFYKLRIKNSSSKRGKRGGFRVIYYLIEKENEIWILKIYSKSEIDNLPKQYLLSLLKE
ncbi:MULTISPECIES: type II toxin-antitoxin system RelE family toxin [unclassified Lebetimonas]|uniref:type II toxin-antitoxin system RelE family toxin n=1 Tax=unclassified Lebetimonas TaxID=2648158 RepID=UPI000467D0A9|nr:MULTISPECIES: type II toxin-antitoxin system RelE/ParE family toxin [unclassified Lebetimonas]